MPVPLRRPDPLQRLFDSGPPLMSPPRQGVASAHETFSREQPTDRSEEGWSSAATRG